MQSGRNCRFRLHSRYERGEVSATSVDYFVSFLFLRMHAPSFRRSGPLHAPGAVFPETGQGWLTIRKPLSTSMSRIASSEGSSHSVESLSTVGRHIRLNVRDLDSFAEAGRTDAVLDHIAINYSSGCSAQPLTPELVIESLLISGHL